MSSSLLSVSRSVQTSNAISGFYTYDLPFVYITAYVAIDLLAF